MDPVSLVAGALAAGALDGLGESATDAVRDAYASLKQAVAERFAGKPQAELVLAELEVDPAATTEPLADQLRATGVADDPRVIELAQALAARIGRPLDGRAGSTVNADLRGSQGAVLGDRNTVTQTFGVPPAQ